MSFFLIGHFEFFFEFFFSFASNQFKLVIVYGTPRMGRNFDDYPGFQL